MLMNKKVLVTLLSGALLITSVNIDIKRRKPKAFEETLRFVVKMGSLRRFLGLDDDNQ